MTLEDLDKVLQILEQHHPKGIGTIALAEKTGIEIYKLRKYLQNYEDYFVALPDEPKYAINSFGRFKGSRGEMLVNHKSELAKQKVNSYWIFLLICGGCFTCAMAVISNTP
jgi:hypothetical protein